MNAPEFIYEPIAASLAYKWLTDRSLNNVNELANKHCIVMKVGGRLTEVSIIRPYYHKKVIAYERSHEYCGDKIDQLLDEEFKLRLKQCYPESEHPQIDRLLDEPKYQRLLRRKAKEAKHKLSKPGSRDLEYRIRLQIENS